MHRVYGDAGGPFAERAKPSKTRKEQNVCAISARSRFGTAYTAQHSTAQYSTTTRTRTTT